eukprot:tig00021319_g20230.t1
MAEPVSGADFLPPFANSANKKLHFEIKDAEKRISMVDVEQDANAERVRVMEEHLKNVQMELLNTQRLVDAKNKEIETEDHLKQLAERETGRVKSDIVKLTKRATELQDQLNIVQNAIFRGNEKMDQFKLLMNWNQEEIEQWALAARQKEDDNLALQKYMRADELKLKELNLQIEKLAKEVQTKKRELESEVTETQAAQIELDKTAEDFRQLHHERQELVTQWEEAINAMQKRDEAIRVAGEHYADGKMELKKRQDVLTEKSNFLETMKANNREEESKIQVQERNLAKMRLQLVGDQQALVTFQDEVEVVKNTLAKVATDLAGKRAEVVLLRQELEDKKRRLEKGQKSLTYTKQRLEGEISAASSLEQRSKEVDEMHRAEELRLKAVEKELNELKENMFKQSQELFKLRQEEANLIAEISGAQTANKNLQLKIHRLDQETLKQQELIYNAEFQIQQLERKVARAGGERTDEEKKALNARIAELQKQLDEQSAQYTMLVQQSKRLADELRAARRKVAEQARDRSTLQEKIADLNLQNETLGRKLKQTIRSKEDVMVQHDVLKLDVKRLREQLALRADEVYGLENRKFQLQQSMEQREKEVRILLDQLKMELRLAEDERHRCQMELNEKSMRVDKLEKKYEIMLSRIPQEEGEGERTQAYYVIKAAQEREELQREGDELDGKIRKLEREVKALQSTLDKLVVANTDYRTSFQRAGTSDESFTEKQQLEEQYDKVVRTAKYRRRFRTLRERRVDSASVSLKQMLAVPSLNARLLSRWRRGIVHHAHFSG